MIVQFKLNQPDMTREEWEAAEASEENYVLPAELRTWRWWKWLLVGVVIVVGVVWGCILVV